MSDMICLDPNGEKQQFEHSQTDLVSSSHLIFLSEPFAPLVLVLECDEPSEKNKGKKQKV